jgi:hypothetical protein
VLNYCIAFAGTFLEFFPVEDSYGAAGVFDRLFSLENAGSETDAWAVSPEHGRQEIMGDAEQAIVDPVLHDQQPASEALFNPVEPVAGGRLSGLHALDDSVTAGHELKLGSRGQNASQSIGSDAESVAGDLHDRAVWTSVQPDEGWCSYQSLVPDNSHFNGLSFLHSHDERNQPAIRKVRKLKPFARLVQAVMVLHLNEA